jgi:hypothetical protein
VTQTVETRTPIWRDPFIVTGVSFAIVMLGLGLGVPRETWIAWFSHPIRVERLGRVPEDTVHGVSVLRLACLVTAIGWVAIPMVVRRLDPRLPRPTPPAPALTGRTVLLLTTVTLLGVLLRVPRLFESLWYDEIAALISSSLHGPGPALGNYHALANHALHSALVALSLEAFGADDAELAIRLPAFLAGIACIPAMFQLGRTVEDDRLGLLAAAVAACMPIAILESCEARGYAFMMLLAILSTTQWLRIADGRRSAIGWYAVTVAAGCWSHLVFACVPLGHAVLAAMQAARRPEMRRAALGWSAALTLGAVTTLFVLAPLLPGILMRRTEFIALDGDEPSVFGIEGLHAIWQLGGSWTWWAALPGIGLLLIGLTETWRWPRLRLAAHTGLAGGVVCVVATIAGGSWLYARFLLFLVPSIAILIAAAIRGAGHFGRRGEPAILAGVMLLVAWNVGLMVLPPKQPIREGVDQVRELVGPEGKAWSIGLGDDVAMFYSEGRGPTLVHAPNLGADLDTAALAVGPDAVIVLYPGLVPDDVLQRLELAGFREHQRLRGWLDWGAGDVGVWNRSTRDPSNLE